MRNIFFPILIAAVIIILFTILPVSAFPDHQSPTHTPDPGTVSITAPPLGYGPYILGDVITFSGTNTNSSTTYLFITGPGLIPGGSRIQVSNPKSRPVVDSIPDTFKAVPVSNSHSWQWQWNTSTADLDSGTYQVIAVSAPRDREHLSETCYGLMQINITRPYLEASGSSPTISPGGAFFVNGTAPGTSYPGIAIWIFGDTFSNRYTTLPDPDGRFSFRLDNTTLKALEPGTYSIVVQHPMQNKEFEVISRGNEVYVRDDGNSSEGEALFTFSGPGRLAGTDASSALRDALSRPGVDDTTVNLRFSVKNATVVPSPAGIPPGGVTGHEVPDVTSDPGTPFFSFENTGDTSLPGEVITGTLGIVLVCGIGGVALITRRKKTRAMKNVRSQNRPVSSGPGRAKDRKKTGTPPEKTIIPKEIRKGTDAEIPCQNSPFPEELVGKYTGIACIGRGGFAIVYSARRITDKRNVAIKIPIRHDEQTGKTFLNEIAIWQKLHHPNIVEVLAVNIFPVAYVEMEYVSGSLEGLPKPLPVAAAIRIIRDVTLAIRYAHANRCIHRDIKPHNILLTDDGAPKITDWGISKVLEDNAKKTTIAGFSLMYAAPEQIAPEHFGSTDERTDIYQIGAVFYELITGSLPFGGESMLEMVNEILCENPVSPSEYNPDATVVDEIILKCLAKDPAHRYQSADELLEAFQFIMDESG